MIKGERDRLGEHTVLYSSYNDRMKARTSLVKVYKDNEKKIWVGTRSFESMSIGQNLANEIRKSKI